MNTDPDNINKKDTNKAQLTEMVKAVGAVLGVALALFTVVNSIIAQPITSLVVALIAAALVSAWLVLSHWVSITQVITAWLALAVVVLAGFAIWPRTMTLEGFVYDTARNPVSNEDVLCFDRSGRRYETRTDADGHYQFIDVPSGKYRVRVRTNEIEGETKGILVRVVQQNLTVFEITPTPTTAPTPSTTPVQATPVLPTDTPTPIPPTPPTATPTKAPSPLAEGPIKFGLQAPITGGYAYEGRGFVKVLKLAVEQKNAAGGILGRQVEIVTCDDVGKPDESSKCATQLVSEGVDAVIGSYSSTCTEPASAIYNEANILHVTPSSTAPRLTTYGYEQFFRVCFLDDRQGLFAAKFIKEDLGIDKAAFLHDYSIYAWELAEYAKGYYEEEESGTTVFYDAINPEDTDFTSILTKIMEADPGVVYFTGYHPQGGLLLKQSKDLGAKWQWVLGNACNNPELIEISGKEAAAGAYVTTEPLPKDIAYPEAQAFVEAYKAKYGEDLASIWWLMVADAFNIIATAMEATGGTDTDAMSRYLHNDLKDYPGVTGPIVGYDEKGDRQGAVYAAYVINEDGEFVPY